LRGESSDQSAATPTPTSQETLREPNNTPTNDTSFDLEAESLGEEDEEEQDSDCDEADQEEDEHQGFYLIDEFDAMRVENSKGMKKKASDFFSMKSKHPWFPVLFIDTTGRKNLMFNFYVPFVHKKNFILELTRRECSFPSVRSPP
jgi:hypothetical protein